MLSHVSKPNVSVLIHIAILCYTHLVLCLDSVRSKSAELDTTQEKPDTSGTQEKPDTSGYVCTSLALVCALTVP